jgi:hypothetical protein
LHKWSKEEIEYVRRVAKGKSRTEIAEKVNQKFNIDVTDRMVDSVMGRYKIRSGRDCRFRKGQEPPNKGKNVKTIGRMAETQFKKGNVPKNHKPVGSISIRKSNKRNTAYQYIKIAEPNKWKMLHVVEYEKHNGPVPKGYIVIFADGDTMNTDISNLLLVSRQQLAVMNRWNLHGENTEQAETAANIASLKIQISKARKKRKKRKGK